MLGSLAAAAEGAVKGAEKSIEGAVKCAEKSIEGAVEGAEKAMLEKSIKAAEEKAGNMAPGPIKMLFPFFGGPVETLQMFEFVVPADKKEDFKKSCSAYDHAKEKMRNKFGVKPTLLELLRLKISGFKQATTKNVGAIYSNGKVVASEPKFQVTAASAAGGAVTLGAGGGVAGLTTGAVIGATVGIVPAIFTFGLSIPFGAAIGGGTGLCIGTAAGSSTGAVVGGATGYEVYTHRHKIFSAYSKTSTFLGNKKNSIFNYVDSSKSYLKLKMAGTGGTCK